VRSFRNLISRLLSNMSWEDQKRSIDRWRLDVADAAEPVPSLSDERSFRRGGPAPSLVHADDRLSVGRFGDQRDYRSSREEPRVVRRRTLVRRPSSYHGGYSRQKESVRSPTQTKVEATLPSRRSSSHRKTSRDEPAPSRSSRALTTRQPPSTLLTSLLPSTRSSRSRTVTYEKPTYERSRYEKSRTRAASPRYTVTRAPEPEAVRYASRPKSAYEAQPHTVIVARKGKRSSSMDVEERMRLLAVRDRFREEVERARDWRSRPDRHREYDRRSVR